MKLLCIHSGEILTSDGIPTLGGGLVEGGIYTTNGEIYDGLSDENAKCYFINELQQLKRCERFLVLNEDSENIIETTSFDFELKEKM